MRCESNTKSGLQDKGLFSSEGFSAKNLMFKDSTKVLLKLPESTDSFLYLGEEFVATSLALTKGNTQTPKLTTAFCLRTFLDIK